MAATVTLHTPWDCKWSRFARRPSGHQTGRGLWECVRSGERLPIADTDCETCPNWEYEAPFEGLIDRAKTSEGAESRATRAVERGVRLSLFVIAVMLAVCGFVVLTRPMAVPLTIGLWMGAAVSLMLGIWGNFRSQADGSFRGFLRPRT